MAELILPEVVHLRQTLVRGPSEFLAVAASPDGRTVAGGASGGCVWLWEAETGQLLRVIEGHNGLVNSVAWAPEGRRLASGSDDRTIRLWEAETGQLLGVLEAHEGLVTSVAWAPEGRCLASGSDDCTIRLWEAETGQLLRVLEGHHGLVNGVTWAPDARCLASGSADRSIRLWEAETGQILRVLKGHQASVRSVAWSPDGRRLASGSDDRTIRLWEADTEQVLRLLEGHRASVRSVAWAPEGRRLASGSDDRTIRLWEAETGQLLRVLEDHNDAINGVAWVLHGRRLASSSYDRTVRLWEAEAGQLLRVLAGHQANVWSVAWAPDGRRLASGLADRTIRLWEAETGQLLQVLEGHKETVLSVEWAPEGRRLASGSADHTIRLWEAEAGQLLRVLEGHQGSTWSVAWAPEGRRLASGSADRTIRLWEAETGQLLRVLEGHNDVVNSVAWVPDGRRLASGSNDRTIRLWEAETGQPLRVLEGHQARVRSVAWSPDGRRLASGSADRTIRLWEAETGQLLRVLEGHQAWVWSVAWSPEGETLASTSFDGEVRIWRPEDGSLVASLRPAGYKHVGSNVAWRAQRPLASSLWGEAILVHAWGEADLRALAAAPLPEQIRLSTAKVVLVGEPDIGKSCFALRLIDDRYEERGTTHGMEVWTLPAQKLDPGVAPPPGLRREVFLWDMGGQPEYRLVHQLFFQDSNICLIFFDPTRGEKAFDEVREWNLRLESQLRGRKAAKLLVRSKLDLGGHVDRARIDRLLEECDLRSYHEVSAKEGTGLPEIRSALSGVLNWAQAEQITRDLFFQQVRDSLDAARERGEVVLYCPDLASELRREFPKEFSPTSLDTVLGQLSLQGLVVDLRLGSGDRVIVLRVDAIERYAGSIILAARDNPRRVPVFEHANIVSARMGFPGLKEDERLPRGDERIVLEAVVQLLIEHGICFLHEGLLVFPSLLGEAGIAEREELPHRVPVYYDFSGAIDNIYASLVTTLALSGGFGPVRLWKDRAEYQETGQGLYGLRKGDDRPGLAHMDLYFNEAAPPKRRELFVSFVEEHLRKEGVTVKESLAFGCVCGDQRFEDTALRKLLAGGETEICCPYCKRQYSLFAGAEKARTERPELPKEAYALRTRSTRQAKRAVEQSKREFAQAAGAAPRRDEKIRVLHLSDLHLRNGDNAIALFQPLSADLQEDLEVERLDYLVVSGDLANKASPEGFDIAREFLSKLVEEFGLSAERTVLVPGNHDQTWNPLPYQFKLARDVDLASLPPDHRVQQGAGYLVRDDELYPKRFALFARCYHIFNAASDYSLDFAGQSNTALFEDTGILFLGLNSAWQIDEFNPKRSGIHDVALSNALQRAALAAGLPIAIAHHAITGNDKIADDAFVGRLVQAGFRLYLHGDVHEGRETIWNPLARRQERLYVFGAGSLSAEAADRPESTPRLYNLLEISRHLRSLRVHTRKQDRKGGPWGPFPKWPVPGDPHACRAYIDIELA